MFIQQTKELQTAMEGKILLAEQWRQYQLLTINTAFDAEKVQAEDELRIGKKQLQDRLVAAIQDKRRKIIEDKNTNFGETKVSTRGRKRGGTSIGSAPQPVAKRKFAPPVINYVLNPWEINDDLQLIFNKTSSRTR
eukprot:TRINITY_DN3940_c0_g1_i1.p1 TRINITY_DN3940_c0_g1~~TRINITY_DN3940_c0_g1_i1.p1  ORF type:complete len:136 (+),score=28.06 TRINITY_DN3940_c0_g1_i1:355-762(+)